VPLESLEESTSMDSIDNRMMNLCTSKALKLAALDISFHIGYSLQATGLKMASVTSK